METMCFSLSTEDFVREAVRKTPTKLKEAIERVSELLDEEDTQDKYFFEVRDGASCLEETQFTVR